MTWFETLLEVLGGLGQMVLHLAVTLVLVALVTAPILLWGFWGGFLSLVILILAVTTFLWLGG